MELARSQHFKIKQPAAQPILGGLIITALTLLVYWPGLSGGFIFDDTHALVHNLAVHLERLSWEPLKNLWQSFIHGPSGRPLAMLSFGVNHYLTGLDPFFFKLTNVCLHAFNALLISLLAFRLFESGNSNVEGQTWTLRVALGLALLWAIHPLQVSTVLYVVQRMEMMALTFTLLGLLAYWRGRQIQIAGGSKGWLWLGGTAVATVLALLSKETGLLVPVFAFCLELVLLRFQADERRTRFIYAGGTLLLA